MKHWSLRTKLIGWSSLMVGVVVVVCGVGADLFLQHEQIEALDDQIANEAEVFFRELKQHPEGIDWNDDARGNGAAPAASVTPLAAAKPETSGEATVALGTRVKEILPMARTERFVEIMSSTGARLYRSENLGNWDLAGYPPGMHSLQIGPHSTRLGVFSRDGFSLFLAVDLSEIYEDTHDLAVGFFVGLPLLMGIVILGGWWIARKALAPIREITIATEQITAQRLDRRLPVATTRDEIGRLAGVLNEMFDRLDRSFRQAARFSADASHELKTPLTVLRSGLDDLLDSPSLNEADRGAVASLLEQTHRLSSITESLLLLSRADVGRLQLDPSLVNVSEIVMACVGDARIMAEGRGISIEMELPEEMDAVVDAGRLEQILLNLLDNAVKYNHDGGRVKISGESASKGGLSILVGNTGPGIPKEHAPQLFERFFRSDSVVGVPGHGLGLSLSRELARAHGGDLILTRSDSEWTEFNLFIRPRSPAAPRENVS